MPKPRRSPATLDLNSLGRRMRGHRDVLSARRGDSAHEMNGPRAGRSDGAVRRGRSLPDMSDQNLTPETLRYLSDQDFRDAWDAIAQNPQIHARGNFMFGREAVGLLELASRVCNGDPSGQALRDFSAELERIEPRYFTPLPAPAQWPGDFDLPSSSSNGSRENQLLAVIFDLVRHGQAHQRQQIMVETTDAKTFGISLTGAGYGRTLGSRTSAARPAEHLSVLVSDAGDVFVVVCPEILFLDLQGAINASGIFRRGLNFDHLKRPRSGNTKYAYTATDANNALLAGGHQTFQPPAPPSQAQLPPIAAATSGRARARALAKGVSAARRTIGFVRGMMHRLRRAES